MPKSDNRVDFRQRRGDGFDPDQDNRDQHDHDGHNRVHRDAKRAVVSIAIGRMDVHYLGHCQKCEQNQAHDSRHSQGTLL
jgi:hypothetical protein